MMVWWTILRAFIGAGFNWFFRGGGIESAVLNYKNFPGGRYVNVLAYGGAAWLQSGSIVTGACASIGMLIGQAPGWSAYIGAMRGQSVTHSVEWGVGMMTLRCLFWGVCLAAGGLIASIWVNMPMVWAFAILSAFSGAMGGVIYHGTIQAFKDFGWHQNNVVNDWTVAEMVHGAFLWAPLCFLYTAAA